MEMDLSPLERIITTPGLQHIAESIFLNVRYSCLKNCKKVNKNWEDILERMLIYYFKTLPAFEKRMAEVKNGSRLSSEQ